MKTTSLTLSQRLKERQVINACTLILESTLVPTMSSKDADTIVRGVVIILKSL